MAVTLYPPNTRQPVAPPGPVPASVPAGAQPGMRSTRPSGAQQIRGLLVAARPYQWAKNVVVLMVPGLLILSIGFAGIVAAIGATVAFCLAASSVYLLNDTADRSNDGHHPVKCNRPIASGLVSPQLALCAAAMAALAAVGVGLLVAPALAAVVTIYLVSTAVYSLYLKRFAYVDVTVLAAGFVLRVLAGAVAVGVGAPPLLLVTVFWGAVFISLGKRRSESALLGGRAAAHRSALRTYTVEFLDVALLDTELVTILAFVAWVYTSLTGSLGAVLGLLAGFSLMTALNVYRHGLARGAGGDPTRDLAANLPVLVGLAATGLIAMSTGIIR